MKSISRIALVLALAVTMVACGKSSPAEDVKISVDQDSVVVNYDKQDYVGMSVPTAQKKAKAADTRLRMVEIDGEPQAVTADFVEGRINAKVEGGVITSYEVEGAE